jgi:RES domain-containing protein
MDKKVHHNDPYMLAYWSDSKEVELMWLDASAGSPATGGLPWNSLFGAYARYISEGISVEVLEVGEGFNTGDGRAENRRKWWAGQIKDRKEYYGDKTE